MKQVSFKPVVALVGRANVGKSTLFNRLTRSRAALVADFSGLTRDRHYGEGRMGDRPFLVVDTGGFEPVAKEGILREMARQTQQAIAEADVVIFLVDARAGVNAHDHEIARLLRRSGQKVVLAVNKAEGMRHGGAIAEFHELGLGEPHAISASHGDGVADLIELALSHLDGAQDEAGEVDAGGEAAAAPEGDAVDAAREGAASADAPPRDAGSLPGEDAGHAPDGEAAPAEEPVDHRIKLAIVGRPNVGKSTLINTLLGEERVIAFDMPGTTRDAISIPFERGGKNYTLIDTAGLRRRGKVFEAVEKFSVIKTLQAIQEANVVVLVLDAAQDISDQDAHIAGFVLDAGRALVVAINKWDAVDDYRRDQLKQDVARKLAFLSFARFHQISALRADGVGGLLKSVDAAYAAAMSNLSTPRLTRTMQAAVAKQAPPRHGTARPKMRYAHQGGVNPPIIVIHGNALDNLPGSYVRYLERTFMEAFKLQGTPLRIQFRTAHNPYANKL